MSKNEIIEILSDWNFWFKPVETGIPRPDYLGKLNEFLGTDQIITLVGPRRAGKSYILRQMAKGLIDRGVPANRILIVNLEDPRFGTLDAGSLERIYQAYLEYFSPAEKPYVFLDEVQEADGWEKWINMMQELKKARIALTGSNARVLSRELGSVLTGRHLETTVLPLSYKEFLAFNQSTSSAPAPRLLAQYLEWGAFPAVVLASPKKEMLLSYYSDIINRDLLRRYGIRKPEALRALARHYLSNAASLSTFHAMEKHLDIGRMTVERFTGYMEQCYLVFQLRRFSFKVREQEKSPRKIYCVDSGLCNAAGFRFSENTGRMAENTAFIELKRRQARNPALELYYWKDVEHREVDFVVKDGPKIRSLIQVCWSLEDPRTRERELKALHKAAAELGIKEAVVLTREEEDGKRIGDLDVRFVPLETWLSEVSPDP